MDPFSSNLLSELIATIIGIVLGIPAGMWLNSLIEKKRIEKEKQKEEKISEKLLIEILTHLEDEISLNKLVLEKLKEKMPKDLPYVSLKTSTWKSLIVQEKTLLTTFLYYQKIFNLYFMFEDFIRYHGYLIDLVHRRGTATPINNMIKELSESTANLIPKILNECNIVLNKINNIKNEIDD